MVYSLEIAGDMFDNQTCYVLKITDMIFNYALSTEDISYNINCYLLKIEDSLYNINCCLLKIAYIIILISIVAI